MKAGPLTLNMNSHIVAATHKKQDPNSSLLCQLFMDNELASPEKLKSLSIKNNISNDLVRLDIITKAR